MVLLHIVTAAAKYSLCLVVPWISLTSTIPYFSSKDAHIEYELTILNALAVVLYRIALHPLHKYPGPFWARITHGYGGVHAMGKMPHIHVYQNFKKYGPVYREGPNRLLFNSLSSIRDIYSNPNITKSRAYHNFRWLQKEDLFDTQDKAEHTRRRRVVGQALSDRTLRSFEPILTKQIDMFLCLMLEASRKKEVINVTVPIKRLAVDIIGHLAFGYALNTLTEMKYRFLTDALGGSIFIANLCYTWATFSWILPVLAYLVRSKMKEYYAALRKFMLARMAQPVDAKADFYSIAKGQLSLKGDDLDQSELWHEAFFFITAGGSTVGTAMAGTLFHLSRHSDWYVKVAQEVRERFHSGGEIRSGPSLSGCKYLRAAIDESLRLSPPSLLSLWRTGDPKVNKPFVVDGKIIPPQTEVAVNLWSIYHTPEYFPEPFAYRPDRWLFPQEGESPNPLQTDEVKEIMKQANVGFGLGDRNCAGKSMAYLETSIFIAKILWYFDFKVAPGEAGKLGAGREGSPYPWEEPEQFQLRDIIAADHDGPNLVFTPRGDYYRELEAKN